MKIRSTRTGATLHTTRTPLAVARQIVEHSPKDVEDYVTRYGVREAAERTQAWAEDNLHLLTTKAALLAVIQQWARRKGWRKENLTGPGTIAGERARKARQAMRHRDRPGAGAAKRRALGLTGREKAAVVMREFHRGTLRSGSGEVVTDENQAKAIAMSEGRRAEDNMAAKKRHKAKHAKPHAAKRATKKRTHKKPASRAKAHKPRKAPHRAKAHAKHANPGVPAAVLELEGIWDDSGAIAAASHIVAVLEHHGVSHADAVKMVPAIRSGLARHAKAHGRGRGLARHKATHHKAQSAAHHHRHHSGHAHRPPATEWERLWKAYTTANASGSLKQQLAAGRHLLRWDRTHGTPDLPHVVTALRQARELLRQHAQAYQEAKALHHEIEGAARAMNDHHARLTGHHHVRAGAHTRSRGLGMHKPAKRRRMFAVL